MNGKMHGVAALALRALEGWKSGMYYVIPPRSARRATPNEIARLNYLARPAGFAYKSPSCPACLAPSSDASAARHLRVQRRRLRLDKQSVFAGSSLCVIGNVNRDFKTSPIPAGPNLLQDGETPVASVVETLGGGGAHSALAAASLGAQVSFAGKVGRDALGGRLERALARQGIAVHVSKDPREATGTSIALAFDDGHRHFFSCLPASRALDYADVDLRALEGKAHLLRADVWFSEPMLFGGNERLLRTARQMGMAVSLDLNWDPSWGQAGLAEVQRRKQAVRALLPLVQLAHGNVRELMEFADAEDLETALKRLAGWGVEAVVAHLGAQGSGYYSQGAWVTEPAAPVSAAKHATGTGDVLSVCMMLLHHRKDLDIGRRLRLANATVAEFMEGRLEIMPSLED